MTTRSSTPLEATAPSPEDLLSAREEGREPPHAVSLTEIVSDAARSGIADESAQLSREELRGRGPDLRVGDPDVDAQDNEFSGEQVPGASNPSPDQNNVDDIDRAYGLTNGDSGAVVSVEELLNRRDRHRWELDPRSKDPQS